MGPGLTVPLLCRPAGSWEFRVPTSLGWWFLEWRRAVCQSFPREVKGAQSEGWPFRRGPSVDLGGPYSQSPSPPLTGGSQSVPAPRKWVFPEMKGLVLAPFQGAGDTKCLHNATLVIHQAWVLPPRPASFILTTGRDTAQRSTTKGQDRPGFWEGRTSEFRLRKPPSVTFQW